MNTKRSEHKKWDYIYLDSNDPIHNNKKLPFQNSPPATLKNTLYAVPPLVIYFLLTLLFITTVTLYFYYS